MARPKLSSLVVKDDLFYRCEFVTDGRIHRTAFYSQLPNMAIPTGDRCLNKMVLVFSVTRQPWVVISQMVAICNHLGEEITALIVCLIVGYKESIEWMAKFW